MSKSMVGFCGGYDMYVSGAPHDMRQFFLKIQELAQNTQNSLDWSLILDRLYKRYVRFDDIEKTKEIMDYCKSQLTKDGDDGSNNAFLIFFRHFYASVSSAISFYQTFNEYRPIKVSVVDLPWYMLEEQRPLEEYDLLEEEPFWLREYTEEDIARLSNL